MAERQQHQHLAVWTTTGSERAALDLAASAVEARLAACAQVDGPITSVYRWQETVQTEPEWRVLFKTTTARYAALEAHLLARHDYDTPEVVATEITAGSAGYLRWLDEETGPADH